MQQPTPIAQSIQPRLMSPLLMVLKTTTLSALAESFLATIASTHINAVTMMSPVVVVSCHPALLPKLAIYGNMNLSVQRSVADWSMTLIQSLIMSLPIHCEQL